MGLTACRTFIKQKDLTTFPVLIVEVETNSMSAFRVKIKNNAQMPECCHATDVKDPPRHSTCTPALLPPCTLSKKPTPPPSLPSTTLRRPPVRRYQSHKSAVPCRHWREYSRKSLRRISLSLAPSFLHLLPNERRRRRCI